MHATKKTQKKGGIKFIKAFIIIYHDDRSDIDLSPLPADPGPLTGTLTELADDPGPADGFITSESFPLDETVGGVLESDLLPSLSVCILSRSTSAGEGAEEDGESVAIGGRLTVLEE